jgi:hypothetical protein
MAVQYEVSIGHRHTFGPEDRGEFYTFFFRKKSTSYSSERKARLIVQKIQ